MNRPTKPTIALLVLTSTLGAACASTVVVDASPDGGSPSTGGASPTGASSSSAPATTSSTTSSPSTTTSSSSGGAGGAPAIVTELGEGATLDSVVAVPGGAVVGVRTYDASGLGVTWSALRVDDDGAPLGPTHALMNGAANGAIGPVALAVNGDRLGAVAWDEKSGCGFVPLDATGAPTGPRHDTGTSACDTLGPTGDGFSFVGSPWGEASQGLIRVTWTGDATGTVPLDGVAMVQGRAALPAGDTLLAWSTDGVECADCPLHVVAGRVGWDPPAVPASNVFADATFGFASDRTRVAVVAVGGGALLAWSPANDGDPGAGAITVVPLADTGAPGTPVAIVPPSGRPIGGLALAPTPGGGVEVVWTRPGDAGDGWATKVRARALDATGAPAGHVVDVATIAGGTYVRAAPTAHGVLALVQQPQGIAAVVIGAP